MRKLAAEQAAAAAAAAAAEQAADDDADKAGMWATDVKRLKGWLKG